MEYVYVIGQKGGPFKIGHSVNPRGRLSNLNCASPNTLEIQHLEGTDNALLIERLVHRELAKKRLAGEWFEAPLEVIVKTIDAAVAGELFDEQSAPTGEFGAVQFSMWRARLGLSQRAAAEALGMHWRSVQGYEAGREIPRVVELACRQIEQQFAEKP